MTVTDARTPERRLAELDARLGELYQEERAAQSALGAVVAGSGDVAAARADLRTVRERIEELACARPHVEEQIAAAKHAAAAAVSEAARQWRAARAERCVALAADVERHTIALVAAVRERLDVAGDQDSRNRVGLWIALQLRLLLPEHIAMLHTPMWRPGVRLVEIETRYWEVHRG